MLLQDMKACIFDFDGVIKDSVEVKSEAFYQLFLPFGEAVANRVREHHEQNGGMSRFDKLPLYLEWSGQRGDEEEVGAFLGQFSKLVMQRVIASPWVCGIQNYLSSNNGKQLLFLVSATPQAEMEEILDSLDIFHFFSYIVGAPTTKEVAIKNIVDRYDLHPKDVVMIGDASNDYEAAQANGIHFVLRRTSLNKRLQLQYKCTMIDDFCYG